MWIANGCEHSKFFQHWYISAELYYADCMWVVLSAALWTWIGDHIDTFMVYIVNFHRHCFSKPMGNKESNNQLIGKKRRIFELRNAKFRISLVICIDGPVCLVRLVHLVRLQTDNFHMFLRQQMDKTTNNFLHDEQMVNGLRKIAWASVFRFPFDVSMSPYPCLHFLVSMSPFLHISILPCQCLHVSMSSSPCLHVSGILQMENRTSGKQQLPFLLCKRKTERANFLLFCCKQKRG